MANKINWFNVFKNNFINNKKATLDWNTWQNNTYVSNNWTPALFTEQSILTSGTRLLLDIWFRILKKSIKNSHIDYLYIKIGKLSFEKYAIDFKSCFSSFKTNKFYKNRFMTLEYYRLKKQNRRKWFLSTHRVINKFG